MYVHDLAVQLMRNGHTPIVYSPLLGPLAESLARQSTPVVDSLGKIQAAPDIIHGHHALETMAAVLHFPSTPAVFVCHDFDAWHDTPPSFPRIHRYIAVDATCRERLMLVHGINSERISVLQNSVDLDRLSLRSPLPEQPTRALVFSNYASFRSIRPIRKACNKAGVTLDVMGAGVKALCHHPEDLLPQYDLVFAKGRCAREAIATGCAVIACDVYGMGGLVTSDRIDDFMSGRRFQQQSQDAEQLYREILRYDPTDARRTSELLRETTNANKLFPQLLDLYEDVIAEQEHYVPGSAVSESRAAGEFLQWWASQRRQLLRSQAQRRHPAAVLSRLLRSASERVARVWNRIA